MSDATIEKELATFGFLSGLAAEHIRFLARHTKHRQFATDQVLHRQGDPASTFYLIRKGHISIEIPAIQGPTLFLQDLSAGDMLGWSWLIPPYRWSFLIRAAEAVAVLEFDGKAVLAHCEEDPKFGYEMLKRVSALMSERLAHARQRMMDEWSAAGFA